MSEPVFYALQEARCLALARRVAAVLDTRDLETWRRLGPIGACAYFLVGEDGGVE